MHLFLPYLLNDSQTINFSKPLLCVTLICGDPIGWFHFHLIMPVMPDKAGLWAQCCFAAPKVAPSGKEWIFIFIQTNVKIDWWSSFPRSARQQVGGQYAND